MKKLHVLLLSSIFYFFTACGDDSIDYIDPNRGFDMWEYMTTQLNYEVEYQIYENETASGSYFEIHRSLNNLYERESDGGITRLLLSANTIQMQEPTGSVNIARFVRLGDKGIFHSPSIQLCTVDRFYNKYTLHGREFFNILQISCSNKDGTYQEFYYGYNEGLVILYQKSDDFVKEYVKIGERRIF